MRTINELTGLRLRYVPMVLLHLTQQTYYEISTSATYIETRHRCRWMLSPVAVTFSMLELNGPGLCASRRFLLLTPRSIHHHKHNASYEISGLFLNLRTASRHMRDRCLETPDMHSHGTWYRKSDLTRQCRHSLLQCSMICRTNSKVLFTGLVIV